MSSAAQHDVLDVRIPGISKIERHGTSHWQVYQGKQYLGFFNTWDAAVAAKAAALGVTPKALKLKYVKAEVCKDEPALYQGLVKIYRGKAEYWQAQSSDGTYIGCSKSLSAAAALIKDHTGVSPKKKPRREWYTWERQVQHLQILSSIYTNQDGQIVLPSDLQSSIKLRRQHPGFGLQAPALQYIAFMGKHGPFKTSLVARWESAYNRNATNSIAGLPFTSLMSMKSLTSGRLSLRSMKGCSTKDLSDSDLDCMIQILQLTALDISTVDFKQWNCNVGHGNCFYSTPLLFLSRFLGVIKKIGNSFKPCKLGDYPKCRENLRAAHGAGELLNKMPVQSGMTLVDYASYVQSSVKSLRELHPPGLNPDGHYSMPWLLRTKLIVEMQAQRIDKLAFKRSDSLELISQAFPDANDWLSMFGSGMNNLGGFLDALSFKHGIEMLTMCFCLFGDVDVLQYNVGYLEDNKIALQNALKKYEREHGIVPHPYVLLKSHTKPSVVLKRPASSCKREVLKRPASSS